jgi:hypothetical protein
LENQKKPSQLGNITILIRAKMTHKSENYGVKMQKYYFCNGTGYGVNRGYGGNGEMVTNLGHGAPKIKTKYSFTL